MKYDIQTLEGALYYIVITITNEEDISDYSIYGNCVCRCGKCYPFEITEHTETGCKVVIPPLCYGIYDYQLFAKNTNNEEHLLLHGAIVADKVYCSCETNVSVPISANTTELKLEIENIIYYDKNNLVYTFAEDGTYAIEGDLSGLTDFSKMTSWNVDLPNLTNGDNMFRSCKNLTSFSADLPNLTDGRSMFAFCSNLTSFSADLPNLTDGYYMFNDCTNLTEWNTPLPNVTDVQYMFQGCKNLTSFSSDLPNLTSGHYMFWNCTNLTSFSADLPNLTNGSGMFRSCSNLTEWNTPLPNLTNGEIMFEGCRNLTSFSADLPNLTNGRYMFDDCKLDLSSVQHIANTINTVSSGTIYIGMSSTIQDTPELETALATIRAKGWTVEEQYN